MPTSVVCVNTATGFDPNDLNNVSDVLCVNSEFNVLLMSVIFSAVIEAVN